MRKESAQAVPPAFDPSLYPVTYRSSASAGLAFFLAVIGYFLFTVIGRGHLLLSHSSGVWTFVLMLGVVILTTLSFICARITLYADRIERKTWFGTQVMQRSDIAGMRLETLFSIPSLIHKEHYVYPFRLPKGIKNDAAWNAWFAFVPDLDALDEKKILADEKGYPKLGTTLQQRERRWETANKLAMICGSATVAAMLLVFVRFVSPFAAAILIVTPWITLANMNLYGVRFDSAKRNPLFGNSLTLMFSGIGLAIFGLLYPTMPGGFFIPQETKYFLYFVAGPACGLFVFVATLRVVFSKSQWKDSPWRITAGVFLIPLMMLFDWGYGIGTAMEINLISSRPPSFHSNNTDSNTKDSCEKQAGQPCKMYGGIWWSPTQYKQK